MSKDLTSRFRAIQNSLRFKESDSRSGDGKKTSGFSDREQGLPDLLADNDKLREIKYVRDAVRSLLEKAREHDEQWSSTVGECQEDTRRYLVLLSGRIIGGQKRNLSARDRHCLIQVLGFGIPEADFKSVAEQLSNSSSEELDRILPLLLKSELQSRSYSSGVTWRISEFETVGTNVASIYGDPSGKRRNQVGRIGLQLRKLLDAERDPMSDADLSGEHAPSAVQEVLPAETLDDVKRELLQLIGLEHVKADVLALQVCHKGVAYPGEQPATVERALWERVRQQLKLNRPPGVRRRKVDALLSDLLYCAQCGEPMRGTYSSRQGRRHTYYVCRSKEPDPKCQQKPVASIDLEPSLMEQLEPILGPHCDTLFLQHSLERITYDSRTREVGVTLVDGSQFAYILPLAKRPGVRRRFEEQQACVRVPRVSRLMALALKFQGLLSDGTVRNHAELAQLGQVSRTRVCQILRLANLARAIQEALLFLPKTLTGPDRMTENRLRAIASLVDWEAQMQLFRSHLAGSQR
jgi:hypothetical protein